MPVVRLRMVNSLPGLLKGKKYVLLLTIKKNIKQLLMSHWNYAVA